MYKTFIKPGKYTLDSLAQLIDQLVPVEMIDLTIEPTTPRDWLSFKFKSNNYEVHGLIALKTKVIYPIYFELTDLDKYRSIIDYDLAIGYKWLSRMSNIFTVHLVRYADMKGLIPDRTKALYLPDESLYIPNL